MHAHPVALDSRVMKRMEGEKEEIVVVNDFTVIQVKATKRSKTSRCLYIKENNSRDEHPSKPAGRTLFVLNVPPYATEDGLGQMFSECGTVKRVFLQSKPSSGPPPEENNDEKDLFSRPLPVSKGYQVAYVVFKDKSSLQRAVQMPYSHERFLSSDGSPLVTGLQKYRAAYINAFPPPVDAIHSQVRKYMEEYDERVEKEKQAAKASEGVPDEEGWITVTRSKGAPNTEAQDGRLKRKLKKRNQEKELLHFYKFQVRESKKEQLTVLRKKFEEDKQKIAQMRAARKFRPY